MVILLTAKPHTGKTTVLETVIKLFPYQIYGIVTRGIIDDPVTDHRSAFAARRIDGAEQIMAQRKEIPNAPKVGNWYVDLHTLEHFVVPAIREGLQDTSALTVLDEIAKIEMASPIFAQLCDQLFYTDTQVLGCITQDTEPWSIPFKNNPRIVVLEVTKENRDLLPEILTTLYKTLIDLQNKLNANQLDLVTILTKEYATKGSLVQLDKLFKHAIRYVVEHKLTQSSEPYTFMAQGDHNTYTTAYNPTTHQANCTCDLFCGRGKYENRAGMCSHIQAARILQV